MGITLASCTNETNEVEDLTDEAVVSYFRMKILVFRAENTEMELHPY